jgi:hypothetical protein
MPDEINPVSRQQLTEYGRKRRFLRVFAPAAGIGVVLGFALMLHFLITILVHARWLPPSAGGRRIAEGIPWIALIWAFAGAISAGIAAFFIDDVRSRHT